ncbi:MAG: NAD(P)-binding domain-containing protein [Lentisphaeria bacterium]|nr:NAD(P)-binding domain-containing protein [Lentisphaeria bacterium]
MKPAVLIMDIISDADAKARLAEYADITEIKSVKYEDLLAALPGKTAAIVPYTEHMLLDRNAIFAGKDLKLVGSTYGGVRQNIDTAAAFERGLTIIHTGASRPRPMAEYTLGLILSSLLQIHNYHHYMRSGEAWPRAKYPRTRILFNRAVGIIGYGRIGSGIASLLKAFTSDISVCSRHLSESDAAAQGLKKRDLIDLCANCEIIILAGGYTPETAKMIGKEQFAAMKDKTLFVNIARGGMVDQQAMIEAVNAREIYLALDVFEKEPLEADSPLRSNDRVLLTPHRANNSIEFEQRWQCLADELITFFKGGTPESALTPERAGVMSAS